MAGADQLLVAGSTDSEHLNSLGSGLVSCSCLSLLAAAQQKHNDILQAAAGLGHWYEPLSPAYAAAALVPLFLVALLSQVSACGLKGVISCFFGSNLTLLTASCFGKGSPSFVAGHACGASQCGCLWVQGVLAAWLMLLSGSPRWCGDGASGLASCTSVSEVCLRGPVAWRLWCECCRTVD